MTAIPTAGYFTNSSLVQSGLKSGYEALIASLRHVPWSGRPEVSATIASGSITPPGDAAVIIVDTEASAATDDLTNIVTTNYPSGAFLLLRNTSASRVVVVKHASGGSGTVQLDRSADYTLASPTDWLLLRQHDGAWYELLRGPQRLITATTAKASTFTVNKEHAGYAFLCTGTYTISLAAAAGVGSGFVCLLVNVGTGVLTVDPNASELIDGASTITIQSGWSYVLACTGTAWTIIDSVGNATSPNPIINGALDVWQKGTTFDSSVTGNNGGSADMWGYQMIVLSGTFVIRRSTDVPTVAQAGVLFNYSMEVDIGTAVASIPVDEYAYLTTAIEGYVFRAFAQRQFTLSFWVKSSKTGTHSISLTNWFSDRSFVTTYTVSSADTWERKSVVIAATPTAGNWSYRDLEGLRIRFNLACGTNKQTGSLNAWVTSTSSTHFATNASPVNLYDSATNFFRITGVKMELGSVATPYEPVSFETEYRRCLRHYQKSFNYGAAVAYNVGLDTGEFVFASPVGASTSFSITIPLRQPMKTGTAFGASYNPSASSLEVRNVALGTNCTGTTIRAYGNAHIEISATTPASTVVGHEMAVHWVLDRKVSIF